jgi:Uma2 family endonuclease
MNQHFRSSEPPATTQAAEGLPRRAWTVTEIEEMVRLEILREDDRFELIGGEIVPMSPKGSKHEHYKGSLLDFWMTSKTKGYRIIPETTFRLDKHTFLEPDFVFYDSKVQVPQLAPQNTLLAVEVSDSSFGYDVGRKARIYSNFGVRALWVINVNTLEIHVFGEAGIDGYRLNRVVGPTETLSPDFAPELAIKLPELPLI